MDAYVTKGTRIQYEFFQAYPACIAGCQPKMGARMISGEGVIMHVYGDDPVKPTKIWFMIQPDSGGPEIEVPQSGVKAVIEED